VAKFCFVVVVILVFLTLMVWQRRRLMNRDRRDEG